MRVRGVLASYFIAAAEVASAVALAGVAGRYLFARLGPPTKGEMLVLQLLAAGILLVATLGRLEWVIQTFGGKSPSERLNRQLFTVLYVLGTWLLFVYLFWRWYSS